MLHLIQTVRDEAHRFAITFHRTRRNARTLTSELEQIPGVGERSIQKLLKTLGSLEKVKVATEEQLSVVVGLAAARKIRLHYAHAPAFTVLN